MGLIDISHQENDGSSSSGLWEKLSGDTGHPRTPSFSIFLTGIHMHTILD